MEYGTHRMKNPQVDHFNQTGLVKWFNESKGYGFIDMGEVTSTGERLVTVADIFVHYTDIFGDGFKTLAEGQDVEFDLVIDAKGPMAINVRKLWKGVV